MVKPTPVAADDAVGEGDRKKGNGDGDKDKSVSSYQRRVFDRVAALCGSDGVDGDSARSQLGFLLQLFLWCQADAAGHAVRSRLQGGRGSDGRHGVKPGVLVMMELCVALSPSLATADGTRFVSMIA